MKEENIRPANLIREADSLRDQDLRSVLEQRASFVRVSCPACGGNHKRPEFEKEGFEFVSCGSCETVFVDPRPTSELLGTYYSDAKALKYWNEHVFPASEDTRRSHIFSPRARQVAELCRKHGSDHELLLDVGAGFGTFCEEIKKLGIFKRTVAVEPSRGFAETCRRKGIETIDKPIESVQLDQRASVITNFELIEHLFCPSDFLKACARTLSQNGLLILTTPNVKGFDLQALGKKSDNIGAPNHLNYFHPHSLSLLLERCGFEVVEVATPGKLDAEIVRTKALAGELDLSGDPFLKHVLLDEWELVGAAFQSFLTRNKLSSHMWVVAKVK